MLSDSDDGGELSLTVNKKFAESYEKKKQREELSKLQTQYGDDEESSSGEEEDEDAELLTPRVEEQIFRTIALIKKKDPRIYDKNTKFFGNEPEAETADKAKKQKKEKPMYLKDYERQRLLEKGAEAFVSDSDDEEKDDRKRGSKRGAPAYAEEQDDLKRKFLASFNSDDEQAASDEEDEEGGGGLFKLRNKTEEEKEREEEDYRKWLRGEGGVKDKALVSEMETLRRYWTDPNLDENERFLRDYVLGKGWAESDSSRLPSYKEIVGGSDVSDTEDEEAVEESEQFERKYNFRFEEPGGDQIMSYPRNIEDSVRRKDDKRREKRLEKAERKKAEKERKAHELKRLKSLKKREILEKLKTITEISGHNVLADEGLEVTDEALEKFGDIDLEGDFDPEAHDRKMRELFNDDYYGEDEADPSFDPRLDDEKLREIVGDDIRGDLGDEGEGEEPYAPVADEDEAYAPTGEGKDKKKKKKKKKKKSAEATDADVDMDADFTGEEATEAKAAGDGKKAASTVASAEPLKGRKQSAVARAVAKEKPKFDPTKMSFEKYFDEYYKLDYEDMIGDLPTRFKYRTVPANDFGLAVDEILEADDKELNQWASLKKAYQYRTEEEERRDAKKYRKVAEDAKKKASVLSSLRSKGFFADVRGGGSGHTHKKEGGGGDQWKKERRREGKGGDGGFARDNGDTEKHKDRKRKREDEDGDAATDRTPKAKKGGEGDVVARKSGGSGKKDGHKRRKEDGAAAAGISASRLAAYHSIKKSKRKGE